MSKKIIKLAFLFFDLFLIIVSFVLAWKVRFFNQDSFLNLFAIFFNSAIENYLGILYLSILIWVVLSYALDLLHVPRTTKRIKDSFWHYVIYPQLILAFILFIGVIFFNYDTIPRLFLFYFLIIQFFLLAISKKIRTKVYQYLRISGSDFVNLGFISNDSEIDIIKNWLNQNKNIGFKLKNLDMNLIYFRSIKEYFNLINLLGHGDYLVLNNKHINKKHMLQIKEAAENKGIYIYRILDSNKYNSFLKRNVRGLSKIGPFKLIRSRKLPIKNSASIIFKRIFDFLFSILFIVFIYWWIYLIAFIMIKIQSKGPVIFKQERIGLDGEIFNCYKFRTMHIDDSNSKVLTKVGDARIFTFGQFMRKTNIDEFPQFINVLIGNMSVVGPRPHMVSEDQMLADKIEKYRIRRWAKPGITGFAAIKGFRGGTESMELMQKRINLDVRYIEKWSFWLDLKICYKTTLETLFLKSKGH